MAKEQRQQDLNMFAWQREQDLNISHEQRKTDRDIAEARRIQEILIAEKQRNMSEQQRAHELNVAERQLPDSLLVSYLNDIGTLLQTNNSSLTRDPVTAIIARVKTLTAIQQLDATRNARSIRFLYEAKQLTADANPLDLTDAQLDDVDFSSEAKLYEKMTEISLAGVSLRNASFARRDLSNANLSGAILTNANFHNSKLINADFSYSSMVRANFWKADIHSRHTFFHGVWAQSVTFYSSTLTYAVFIASDCSYVDFRQTNLEHADFTSAKLKRVRIDSGHFVRTNFYGLNLENLNFTRSRFRHANFTKATCALLPNRSIINEDPNLIQNGDPSCAHSPATNSWQIQPVGAIGEMDTSDCMSVSLTNTTASMSQNIDLQRYNAFTSRSRTIAVVSARVGGANVSICINNHKGEKLGNSSVTRELNHMIVRVPTRFFQIQVVVQFIGYGWCDDLKLTFEATPR